MKKKINTAVIRDEVRGQDKDIYYFYLKKRKGKILFYYINEKKPVTNYQNKLWKEFITTCPREVILPVSKL